MAKDYSWMEKTGPGKRTSEYSKPSRESVRSDGKIKREDSNYRAEKMDKGLPLKD